MGNQTITSTENVYYLACITLRLVAIYLAIQVINLIPTWVATLTLLLTGQVKTPTTLFIASLTLIVVSFILPLAIWLTAKPLAKKLIKSIAISKHANDISLPHFTGNLQKTLLLAVGVLLFCITFPELFVWACRNILTYRQTSIVSSVHWWQAATPLLQLLLALWLIFRNQE